MQTNEATVEDSDKGRERELIEVELNGKPKHIAAGITPAAR